MSDDAHCDNCQKHGRRPRMYPAPPGWFYLEAVDDDNPSNCIIILACSIRCIVGLWHRGPGERLDAQEVIHL